MKLANKTKLTNKTTTESHQPNENGRMTLNFTSGTTQRPAVMV